MAPPCLDETRCRRKVGKLYCIVLNALDRQVPWGNGGQEMNAPILYWRLYPSYKSIIVAKDPASHSREIMAEVIEDLKKDA